MIFGAYALRSTCHVEGTSKEDARKVEERLFQECRKTITKQYANRANPSSITKVTRF